METSAFKSLFWLAVAHIAVTAVHSAAHTVLGVLAPPLDTVYIVVVIILAPIAGTLLLRRRPAWGALVLALSLLGSFAYGGYYHFLDSGHDNVHHVIGGAWASVFGATAWMLAAIDSIGSLAGFLTLIQLRAAPEGAAPR